MKKMLAAAAIVGVVALGAVALVDGAPVPTVVAPSADGAQWFSACATGTTRSSESATFYLPGANPNGPNAPTYPLKGYTIEAGLHKECAAYGYYVDTVQEVGWGYLHMESSQDFDRYTPQDMAYAAGYLEGYLTSEPTYQSVVNTFPELFDDHNGTCPQAVLDWIQENNVFQDQMISSNPTDPYWTMVGVQWAQVQGIYDGYQAVAPASEPMSLESLAILNLLAEISDIETVTNTTLAAERDPLKMHNFHQVVDFLTRNSHCSALIRLTPGNADLIPAHTTWTGYENMLRVYKYYNIANAGGVHFSSYPGTIASSDDYYTTDAGLVVIETTNSIANMSLYQYVTPQTVPCFIRTMVANALAVTGQEWTQLFAKFNSGTYSNQWMVVDFKQFTIGQTPRAGTLWIAEQMPGEVVTGDVTDVLIAQGYWASYNIAYFPEVWARSGYADLVKEYGDMGAYYYDYYGSFRELIFARDAPTVDSIDGMQRLIRQNNWQSDPYSKNCSELAVASRQDLSVGPLSAGRSPFGSIDGKVTSASLWNPTSHYVRAQSGPTYENQAPFVWSTSGLSGNVGHLGQPDRWEFPWVEYVVQRVNPPHPVRHASPQKPHSRPAHPQASIMEA